MLQLFVTGLRTKSPSNEAGEGKKRIPRSKLEPLLPLLFALANHCFRHEYIHELSPVSIEHLAALRSELKESLKQEGGSVGGRPGWEWERRALAALVASTEPLLPFLLEVEMEGTVGHGDDRVADGRKSGGLLEGLLDVGAAGDACAGDACSEGGDGWELLLRVQVEEPHTERELAMAIPTTGPSEEQLAGEGASAVVQRMYEESPYPRWAGGGMGAGVGLGLGHEDGTDHGAHLLSIVRSQFPSHDNTVWHTPDGTKRILVAGAGTGRSAVTYW
jgi:hypothetical protein